MNTLSFEGCFQTTAASSLAGRSFIMASHQPMNWMASSQGNTSIPELMSAHQRQWQEHLIMTGQQNPGTMPPMANPLGGDSSSDLITKSMSMPVTNNANPNMVMNQMNQINFNSATNLQMNPTYASSTNLSQIGPVSPMMSAASAPHLPPQQYAMWQQQYQSANHGAFSASNIHHSMPPMQQMQAMHQMQGTQYGSNQRLFNQQRRMNGWGTTGQMDHGNGTGTGSGHHGGGHSKHKLWVSQDDVDQLLEDPDLEQQESIDHVGFVPPAPQSKAEIENFVHWKAQRNGIQQQKEIDRQVEKQMKAMSTEDANGPLFTDASVRQISEYSEIDYALMEESSKKGKCCVVL